MKCLAVGAVMLFLSDATEWLHGPWLFSQVLLLAALILALLAFYFMVPFLLLKLGIPKFFTLEETGIRVEGSEAYRGASALIPWSGVLRVRSSWRGSAYDVVLVDREKRLGPRAAKVAATNPGVLFREQTSRIELTSAQWASISGRVPTEKHPR